MEINISKFKEDVSKKISNISKLSKKPGKLPKKYVTLAIIIALIVIGIFIIVKINTNESTVLLEYDEVIPLASPVELNYTIFTSGIIRMKTTQNGVVNEDKAKISSSMLRDLKKYVLSVKANVPRIKTKTTKGEMKVTIYNKKAKYPLDVTGIKTNPSAENKVFSDLIKSIEKKYITPFYN